jgi:hypothetical protein
MKKEDYRFKESGEIAFLAKKLEAALRKAAGSHSDGKFSREVFLEAVASLKSNINRLGEDVGHLESYVGSGGPDIPTSSNAHQFFENLSEMKKRLGEQEFIEKLITEMTRWPGVVKDLIYLMAWNDHNSDWYLNTKEIAESMTLDGEPITSRMVAESLSSMVE